MKLRPAAIAAALLVPLVSACVTSSDIDNIRKDIDGVKRQVYSGGQESVKELTGLATKLDKQTNLLLKSNADVGAKIDTLTNELQALQGRLDETTHRLTQLSQQIAQTQKELANLGAGGSPPPSGSPLPVTDVLEKPPLPMTPPASSPSAPPAGKNGPPSGDRGKNPSGPEAPGSAAARPAKQAAALASPNPQDLYQGAYSDYLKGSYDLAIAGFREYVETYPKTENTPAAHYWIGECWYSEKKYREAITAFDTVITRFPKSEKAASALLKKGYAYLELGEKGRAASQFQYLVREYPTAEESALAKQRLKSLGVESR
jgi:tol-pal system protein YbgF